MIGIIQIGSALAANIRAERARAALSQQEAADKMAALGYDCWSRQTLAQIERGRRRVVAEELPGLALTFGCSVAKLTEGW